MTWDSVADVESDSQRGVRYTIKRHPATRRLGCSCMAYRFSPGSAKTCKHIEVYRANPLTAAFEAAQSTLSVVHHDGETFTFRRAISFGRVPTTTGRERRP